LGRPENAHERDGTKATGPILKRLAWVRVPKEIA
jgi:hypothetical protein